MEEIQHFYGPDFGTKDEIARLRERVKELEERYSQPCSDCLGVGKIVIEYKDGHSEEEGCFPCKGTGRIWMMGVKEIRNSRFENSDAVVTCRRILNG